MENEVDVTILPRTLDLVFWLVSSVPVIFLLLWDVGKAWKRRAFWIPGQALVLSALIIQLLSFIDYSHIRVYSGSRCQTKEVVAILVKNQLVIDSGRLMMCVLIAYLLPGMARSGSITNGSNFAALALSIIFHVFSELRSIWKVEKRNESLSALAASSEGFDRTISDAYSTTLILVIIYLLGLLIRAVMIGRKIRRIMSRKIHSAISCCTAYDRPGCNDIKDHVRKCWIVVRLSQPDYVLARSGLCSMVCRIVTACIGLHVINWRHVLFTDNESLNNVTKRTLVQFVIFCQFVIVLIGWIVLFVRGVTSRMHGDIFSGDYFKSMSIEDVLTDLTACFIRTAYFMRLFVRDKRIQEKRIREMNKKIREILWYPRHWVQKLFQIFSMQNPPRWLTSTKRWLSRIKTRVIESVSIAEVDNRQFPRYKETLSMLLIPGESAQSLWKANQWGFRKVERYMEQGQEDARCSPSELISFLKTGTPEDEADREKAKSLQRANRNSWKRTAVSLIHIMIYFYDGSDASVIEDAMQCYDQAREYMNFVDGLNEEVKSVGREADEEFDSLQHTWNNGAQPGMLEMEIREPLRRVIQDVKSCSAQQRRNMPNFKYCMFETWTGIDLYLSAPEINKVNRLQRVLANVYFFYMTEAVNKAVLQKCSKLAEEGMEEEILDVAFLSAKAQGVLDKVGEGNDPVELPHNTDQGSISSLIQTENPLVGEGKGQAELPSIELIQSSDAAAGTGDGIRSRRPTETAPGAGEDDSTDPDKEKTL